MTEGNNHAIFPKKWPPQCCVPAFMHSSLVQLKVEVPDANILPSKLGVLVGPKDENPFHLEVVSDSAQQGVTQKNAEILINKFFFDRDLDLAFRHVPFQEISLGLYDEVLKAAMLKEISVGVGLDFSKLTGDDRQPVKHVLRVKCLKGSRIKLFDDSREHSPPEFEIEWTVFEAAVLAIHDGYWLIGKPADLELPLTLPWHQGSIA